MKGLSYSEKKYKNNFTNVFYDNNIIGSWVLFC